MDSDRNLGDANSTENMASMENVTSMTSDAAIAEEDSMMYGIPKSPGSLLGSSIRSNQVESFDIESESCSVTGENPGWRLGMPWFSNNHNRHSKKSNKSQDLHRYYGGIMKASGEASSTGPASPASTKSTNSRHFRPLRKSRKSPKSASTRTNDKQTSYKNKEAKNESTMNETDNLTVPIARTKSSTADSIADFDDSEWTPPDSSYGAACPVCGCIPKRVRQMIEMTLITAFVFGLIYLVVNTSMKIAEAHRQDNRVDTSNSNAADAYFNRTSTSSSNNLVTDDDVYVEKYNNDDGGDDVTASDDNYNNDDSNDDQYAGDDRSQNNNYKYYGGNSNRYYQKNYNYYNGNNDDYSNRKRRWLRGSEENTILNIQKRRWK